MSTESLITPIYEDNHLLIINKPAGWLSQGDITGDLTAIEWGKKYIKRKYNKPGNVFLGLCHRLDRPVSGALLLARTSKALERINKAFRDNTIDKTYWAISHRIPKRGDQAGSLTQWLLKDTKRNMVRALGKDEEGAKRAITHWEVLGSTEGFVKMELHPETGRSHQLRVAMQTLKCPIVGDVKYGGMKLNEGAIALHCRQLQFIHPVTKEPMTIVAPVPEQEPWIYF